MKTHFRISYDDVKNLLKSLLFLFIFWRIIDGLFIYIQDWNLFKIMGVSNSFKATTCFLIIGTAIYVIYLISEMLIDLIYWFFVWKSSESKFYPYLTHSNIKIPLLKKDYWKIKTNKMFFKSIDFQKPIFKFSMVDEWAKKIIYKEIQKINKNAK